MTTTTSAATVSRTRATRRRRERTAKGLRLAGALAAAAVVLFPLY